MQTTKPSVECAPRHARRLRDEVDGFTLGDPPPGRSWLDKRARGLPNPPSRSPPAPSAVHASAVPDLTRSASAFSLRPERRRAGGDPCAQRHGGGSPLLSRLQCIGQ
jgi:hypothetical protein